MGVVRLAALVILLLSVGAGTAAATATTPGAPTLRTASAASSGISVTWSAPASDGGSPLTGFRVYRAAGNTAKPTLLASLGLVDSYTDATTVAGTTYAYDLTAVNAVGEGPPSNPLSATAVGPNTGSLFQPYQAYPVGSTPDSVAVGDVTGDGRNDVVMTTTSANDPAHDYHLFVFAQATDGSLSAPVSYPLGAIGPRTSVAVGDLTGDGGADVAVGVAGAGVDVFPQLAGGLLGTPTLTPTADADKIRLGQLNGDAALDVAGVGWGTNTVTVLLNDGRGGFLGPVSYPAQHAGYEDLEVGDVTGDGRDDLVAMSGQGLVPDVSVLAQLAGGGFGVAAEYSVPGTTQGIGVGDVTGDGRNDLVVSYGGNSPNASIAVLAQTPAGTLGAPVRYASYDIPQPVEVGDVDLDGRADVVTLHGGWLRAGLYRQQADGMLAPEELYAIPSASQYNPHGLGLGDIDGDGSPDIVVADSNNGLVVLRSTLRATAPSAPLLTNAAPGNARVTLSWSPPSSNGGAAVIRYRIYRGSAANGETLLATVGNVNGYVDSTAANGTTYYYEVTAVNAVGESARSNEIAATPATVPGAPTLTSAKGAGGVALTWSAPGSNGGAAVGGYRVYRGGTSGGETLLATVGSVTAYTDTTAPNGKTSYYQVSAVNRVGEGPRSNELSAKPKH